MAHQDPIADMLTQIRNRLKARRPFVDLALSRQKLAILQVLEKKGWLSTF